MDVWVANNPAPHTAVLRQLQFCDKAFAVAVTVPDADIRTDRFAPSRLCVKAVAVYSTGIMPGRFAPSRLCVKAVAVSRELPCAFLFFLRLCVDAVAVAVRSR
jgi:hypothetical protein